MKRSLMLLLEQPNSAVSIRAACLGLGAQDVTARPWNTSTKSHSPPAGRFVQTVLSCAAPSWLKPNNHVTRGNKGPIALTHEKGKSSRVTSFAPDGFRSSA